MREATYASIIYRDLRCELVHEYRLAAGLAEWPLDPNAEPHYVNYLDLQGSRARRLYLPYEYVRQTVKGAIEAACNWWDTSTEFTEGGRPNRPAPSCWWVDGR